MDAREKLAKTVDYVGPGMDTPDTMSAARENGYYDRQDVLDAMHDDDLKDELHALGIAKEAQQLHPRMGSIKARQYGKRKDADEYYDKVQPIIDSMAPAIAAAAYNSTAHRYTKRQKKVALSLKQRHTEMIA